MNPSLEYLHGYNIFRILIPEEGHRWAMEFDNGAVITNEDETLAVPDNFDEVTGLALITTIFSETDTTLRLGTVGPDSEILNQKMIALRPTQYSIIDPRFGGDPYIPQVAPTLQLEGEREPTIREMFDERAVEAPTADPGENDPEAVPAPEEAENAPQSLPQIDVPGRRTAELS